MNGRSSAVNDSDGFAGRRCASTGGPGEAAEACVVFPSQPRLQESKQMLDVIFLVVGLGFFALSVGYAYACDRL
jgi:hypothetical protein